jgi:hypothetical protein
MALAIKTIIVSFVLLIVISSLTNTPDVSISYIPQTSDVFGGELQLFLVLKNLEERVFFSVKFKDFIIASETRRGIVKDLATWEGFASLQVGIRSPPPFRSIHKNPSLRDLYMFRFIITWASHLMMDKAHGEGIPTIPGWTQGPPCPRPLILRTP